MMGRVDGDVSEVRPSAPAPPPGSLSTSLFDDIWLNALDPSYAEAAAKGRQHASSVAENIGLRARTAAILLAVGLLVVLAVGDVRRHRLANADTHKALVAQVTAREHTVTALEAQVTTMRRQLTTIQNARLAQTGAGAGVQHKLDILEGQVSAVAVTGPGVIVRLSDAPTEMPSASAGTGQDVATRAPVEGDAGRLTDRDLQDVVNALWAAGAEAISINGQRLGPTSAIRTAGSAVLVDFRPVTSPYSISAIGGEVLETDLADSAVAQSLSTRSSAYGIGFGLRHSDHLALPAAAPADPVEASAAPTAIPSARESAGRSALPSSAGSEAPRVSLSQSAQSTPTHGGAK